MMIHFSKTFFSSFFPSSALEHTFYVPSPPTYFLLLLLSFLLFYFFLTPIAIWCVFFLFLIFAPSLDFFTAFLSSLHRRLIILCQNHIVLMSPSIDDSSPFSRLILFPSHSPLPVLRRFFPSLVPYLPFSKALIIPMLLTFLISPTHHLISLSSSQSFLAFPFLMPFVRKNL